MTIRTTSRALTEILNRYHLFDARDIHNRLPGRPFVDVTITSPPYWNLKDYGGKSQVGFGQSYEECLDDLEAIFKSVFAVTKKSGSLWLIADTLKVRNEMLPFPFDLATRLTRSGWVLQDIVIWQKDKTLPWSHKGKLRNIFEYILLFTKEKSSFKYYLDRVREIEDLKSWWIRYPERYSPFGKAPLRHWSVPIPTQGSWSDNWVRHYCPLPPALVARMLKLTTDRNDVVLDPFSGSGIVLATAKALGRRYVGVDLSPKSRTMFFKTVLPTVDAMNGELTGQSELKRRVFSRVIWKLRKLKMPAEVCKLLPSSLRQQIAAVLALSDSQKKLRLTFLTVPRPSSLLPETIARLLSKPPLSKYEVKVEFNCLRMQELARPNSQRGLPRIPKFLYLYPKFRTYKPGARVSSAEVPALVSQDPAISIFSNLRLDLVDFKK